MSVRILHAADLHLDSPFEALSGAQAAQRRREQRDLLRALPELARAHGAQIILLAGDLLDSGSPYPETAKALAETFDGCGAEVFLAPGNHDYYSAGAPYARLTFPENVHIFRTQRIEAVALPELGVRGAAWATVIGQLVSMGLGLAFHLHFDVEIKNSSCYFKPDRRTILGIYSIGLPAIISQALLTVMTYSLNLILGGIPQVGQNAVTVYGLYYKIQQLIIFAAFGVRDAITPIVSFNYGAQKRQRVKDGIRWGLIYTSILMLAGCLGVELFAGPLAGLFSLSETTLPMCVSCMRIVSLGFLFAGSCIAFQGVFQALECGIESLVISLCRQVIFVLPPVWLLSRTVTGAANVNIVWVPLAAGEAVTLVIALLLFRRAKKNKVDPIPE